MTKFEIMQHYFKSLFSRNKQADSQVSEFISCFKKSTLSPAKLEVILNKSLSSGLNAVLSQFNIDAPATPLDLKVNSSVYDSELKIHTVQCGITLWKIQLDWTFKISIEPFSSFDAIQVQNNTDFNGQFLLQESFYPEYAFEYICLTHYCVSLNQFILSSVVSNNFINYAHTTMNMAPDQDYSATFFFCMQLTNQPESCLRITIETGAGSSDQVLFGVSFDEVDQDRFYICESLNIDHVIHQLRLFLNRKFTY